VRTHFFAGIHIRRTILTIQADPTLLCSSKVTSRGQITIPQDIRDKFKISPDEKIYFLEENGKPHKKRVYFSDLDLVETNKGKEILSESQEFYNSTALNCAFILHHTWKDQI